MTRLVVPERAVASTWPPPPSTLEGETIINSASKKSKLQLPGVYLIGADLSDTSLGCVGFHNANFTDATLLDAELSSSVHFDGVIWGNTTAPAGTHEIYAIAYDDNGVFAGESASTKSETVTITVEPPANNQPPSVEITSPRNN